MSKRSARKQRKPRPNSRDESRSRSSNSKLNWLGKKPRKSSLRNKRLWKLLREN